MTGALALTALISLLFLDSAEGILILRSFPLLIRSPQAPGVWEPRKQPLAERVVGLDIPRQHPAVAVFEERAFYLVFTATVPVRAPPTPVP